MIEEVARLVRRRGVGGLRTGEMLQSIDAELFGALPGRAVGIETNVGLETVEERGIIFLLKMDDGEQTVDGGLLRGSGASLFGDLESELQTAAR